MLVPRSLRTRLFRPGRLAISLAALTLPAGAAIAGLMGPAAPDAGASGSPTPSFIVTNYSDVNTLTFPLSASANATPSAINSSPSLNSPTGSALDAAGDLWVANDGTGPATLVMFTASQLAATGSPTAAVTITATYSGAVPSAVAFDAHGDLWVSNFENVLAEYTPSQLQSSGSPTPAVLITGASAYGWGLSFDSAGDLWVGDYGANNDVVEYTPSQLATSGSPTPAVTIGIGANTAPVFPTFDAQGDMWVSQNTASGTPALDEFTPSQLAASGSPTPAVQLTGGGLNRPSGLEFDTSGNLWVANFAANSVAEYAKSQLAATGSPTPANTIVGSNTAFDEPADVTLSEPPVVSSVSPTAGHSGTTVTISGAGFLVGSSVNFGSTPASSVTYVSPYELMATAPAGAGTVDVTVSTSGGTSATSPADQFTYSGYVEVAADGGIFNYGTPFYGSQGGMHLNAPIVGIAGDPATGGYWEVAADGGVFGFNAPYLGGRGGQALNAPIVGIAATKDGGGYWLVAKDGGIFNYGDAAFAGSMGGKRLNSPVVGIAADTATGGYWEVASDGGIFNFNAPFLGSRGGQALNAPVVGIASSTDGAGYWLVAKDGGIFNYGVPFVGSRGGQPLNAPVVGIAAAGATGYWEVASDGGIFNYGAPFLGSRGGQPLNAPVVGIGVG